MNKKSLWLLILSAIAIAIMKGTEVAFAIKPGVYGTLKPEMDPVMPAVAAVWNIHGLGIPTISSIMDGTHMQGSKHPLGLAVDIRLNDIPLTLHETLRVEVLSIIDDRWFDVIHEYHGTDRDHLHIEYDPK